MVVGYVFFLLAEEPLEVLVQDDLIAIHPETPLGDASAKHLSTKPPVMITSPHGEGWRPPAFPNQLRQLRQQQNLSRKKLVFLSGVSLSTIVRIESYDYLPTLNLRTKLIKTLGVTETDIWPHFSSKVEPAVPEIDLSEDTLPAHLLFRTMRERKGWSIQELATRARVDGHSIYRLEKGQVIPYEHHIQRICQTLGITGKLNWQYPQNRIRYRSPQPINTETMHPVHVARRMKEMTITDLVKLSGVSKLTIRQIEKHFYRPSLPVQTKLAEALGKTVESLFSSNQPTSPNGV